MFINSINSTNSIKKSPMFKSVREDRNTVSQLKQNNDYSLTEPNQRRINQALENLAKQRGEENIKFLLDLGQNLTYQTNINNGKATKNEWKSKIKNAAESSLAISNPILKEKYSAEISRVFDEPKELSADEKKLIEYKKSIMSAVDVEELKKNPNENIRNLDSNLDYFITSTETPLSQKVYVMSRLDYMMSPDYQINEQLKDKKTQVLAEMVNDMVINTPDSKVPNIKAVNQKTHGMCAAISIVRKTIAYEDKPNYVDSILSELDNTDSVMVYDRHNLGSGKRVPVKKTYVDFDYAQEMGYRIIDASTLQWMGIAGLYGSKNESLQNFTPFDKEHFDAYHDSFFLAPINKDDVVAKQRHYQSLIKAKEEVESAKASIILDKVNEEERYDSRKKNLKMLAKFENNTAKNIKELVSGVSNKEVDDDLRVLSQLLAPTSDRIEKTPEEIRKYAFIPNEEQSQKAKKVKAYFEDKYSSRISDKVSDEIYSNLVSNMEYSYDLRKSENNSKPLSAKVAFARKMYAAEAAYRNSVEVGLDDADVLMENMMKYNIADTSSRISQGYQTVIDRISNKNDKKLQNHFAKAFGLEESDKEGVIAQLAQIKASVDYISTSGLDELYSRLGVGSRRETILTEIEYSQDLVNQNDKDEISRLAQTLNVANDKKVVAKELDKLSQDLISNPDSEKAYKQAINKLGYKNEMKNFADLFNIFVSRIQDTSNPEQAQEYLNNFVKVNEMPENTSIGDVYNAINAFADIFNTYSQTVSNSAYLLNVPNEDGSLYFTVDEKEIILKKMEKEGKIVPKKNLRTLQERFNRIDKIRSTDEFSSRQGKISDGSLYELSSEEKDTVKAINNKLNKMHSDVKKEYTEVYRQIKTPLEKHARYIGTNIGHFWVSNEGSSGLNSSQQVKIFEQITDRPYSEISDIENAVKKIKTGVHSGVSSSSVFSDRAGGWHAQYVADVKPEGTQGKDVLYHDNSWGASEHENTWVDSEGLTRTDYSDRRGGDLGYITNSDWRNGNYVENLTKKAGHVTPHNVENRVYNKLRPKGSEYKFNTMTGIILPGKDAAGYDDIAATIKDSIFLPESVFLPDIFEQATKMDSKQLQKAMFRAESAGTLYRTKFDKIVKRLEETPFNKGISSKEDYDKLADDDIVKLTFEKAALLNSYPDQTGLRNLLMNAKTVSDINDVKRVVEERAFDSFEYSFGKKPEILLHLSQSHVNEISKIIVSALSNNSISNEKAAPIAKGMLEMNEGDEFTGRMSDTINYVLDKVAKQFDENVESSENASKAKEEMVTNLRKLFNESLYFNSDDLNSNSERMEGIRNWIDEKFNPKSDEEFVEIYRRLQDMSTEEFKAVGADITNEQLGISSVSGYDLLQKFKAANDSVESEIKNVLFVEELYKDIEKSETTPAYRYKKLEKFKKGDYFSNGRTFDELYREMYMSLSSLTYEKMFNKYKDANFRAYGAFPAYPKLDLMNNKTLKDDLEIAYQTVGEVVNDIITKKVVLQDYNIIDKLDSFRNELKGESLTDDDIKYIHRLAGKFVTMNMTDSSVETSVEAAQNLLELSADSSYEEFNSNVEKMVNEFDVIRQANSAVDLDEYFKDQRAYMDKTIDTLLDISIPTRYQKKLKDDASAWVGLEVKYATQSDVKERKLNRLEQKLALYSYNPESKYQIRDFQSIVEAVKSVKAMKESKTEITDEQLKSLEDMASGFAQTYIKPENRTNAQESINSWIRKEIHNSGDKEVTEDMVLDARDKFESDFMKYHYVNNPIELLNTTLLLSTKDGKEKYPQLSECNKELRNLLSSEMELTKFVEIQEALMEAVDKGNSAHVKEYFDNYMIHLDDGSQISMNSDYAIDQMIKSLQLDDNSKTAKMFVEKLGLGDRVMKIESEYLEKVNPKKLVDDLARYIASVGSLTNVISAEKDNLSEKAAQGYDIDEAVDEAKNNILKKCGKKKDLAAMVKVYVTLLDTAKSFAKSNPDLDTTVVIGSVHNSAMEKIQEVINQQLKSKQDSLSAIDSFYNFLLGLRLPENSEGYMIQQQMKSDYAQIKKYNNEKLLAATKSSSVVSIK